MQKNLRSGGGKVKQMMCKGSRSENEAHAFNELTQFKKVLRSKNNQ